MGPAHVNADHLKLRWLSPPEIRRLRLTTPDDEPLVTVADVTADLPLWKRLLAPSRLGRIQLTKPEVSLFLDDAGISNFSRTFADSNSAAMSKFSERATMSCDVHDGSFHFRRAPDAEPWTIGPLNVTVGLERIRETDTTSTVVIEPGVLIDNVGLTPEISDDILKYIAPVLANVSWVEGSFSLAIDQARLPLADLSSANIKGTLSIHAVRVGANNVVRKILAGVGLPTSVQLIEESPVQFELADGRVWHRGLRFEVGTLSVETTGFVALDQSLDLVATVTLPDFAEGDSPLTRALSQRQIEIPIEGTLAAPKARGSGLLNEGRQLLTELMPQLLNPDTSSGQIDLEAALSELWKRRRQRIEGNPSPGGGLLPGLGDRIRDILEPPPDDTPAGQASDSAPRRPILDRLQKRWRERKEEEKREE